MPAPTIYPESSISSRSSMHHSCDSRAPSHVSHRSSSSRYSNSSHRSLGPAATSASRSQEYMEEGYGGSTFSRSSRSDDRTVRPASSSGRAHTEYSNSRAMIPYSGNSSRSTLSRGSSDACSYSSRSNSGSQTWSRQGSSSGQGAARRDEGRMDRIEEEPTLKGASVRELLDEADRKLGVPKYQPVHVYHVCPYPRWNDY